ncbi:MAG: hypothetical protein ABI325_07915 [Ginsengibacter sp.]
MGKNKAKKVIQMSNSPESYIKTRARNLPIDKCYINESWSDSGFATIIISRKHVNGNFTFGVYLVDLYCLGVKDTFYNFNVYTEFIELLDKFKKEQGLVESEYALAHNIIYGAVEYAGDLGFKPDKDFEVSQYLLEEDDDEVEFIDVEFGLNGKPAIFIWKEKHPANIIATLERSVGKGNFTSFTGEDTENDDDENDDCDDGDCDDDFESEDEEDEYYDRSLSEDEIVAIFEGKKKAPVRIKTRLTFAMYDDVCTEEERTDMHRIMDEEYTWKIVDEDETGEPPFLNEENESTYRLLNQRVNKDTKDTIADIEAVIAENPDEYHFHNLLSIAYELLGDRNKEYEIVDSTYKRFPHRIFAFTNYLMTFGDPDNHNDRKRPLEGEFDFHKFFPQRHNLSIEELLSLAGALFFYFTEELGEYHKGIAYAIPLCRFIFDKYNRAKANQILLFASECMLEEITKKKGLDKEMSEDSE